MLTAVRVTKNYFRHPIWRVLQCAHFHWINCLSPIWLSKSRMVGHLVAAHPAKNSNAAKMIASIITIHWPPQSSVKSPAPVILDIRQFFTWFQDASPKEFHQIRTFYVYFFLFPILFFTRAKLRQSPCLVSFLLFFYFLHALLGHFCQLIIFYFNLE